MQNCINIFRGCLVIALFGLNLIFIPILTILLGFLAWLIRIKSWQNFVNGLLQKTPVAWAKVNSWIMEICTHGKWDIQGPSLDPKAWYILISNHRSWVDILVLGYVFAGKAPSFKFFLKKELLWTLPIAGLACKAVGFPFMERHSREDIRKNPSLKNADIETTRIACEKFKAYPCTIINFVEGTRFSEEKRARQESPYQHCLKPKSGGFAVVLSELHTHLKGILNVTINYSEAKFSFWDFACGRLKRISVHYQLLPITQDLIGDYYQNRLYRAHIQNWLNQLWQAKDHTLETFTYE
ncbi:MAG TPA: acyltransferase [Coxiellaceae bacterium]|nr:acyltransferase [Coxiellaceae bacterium]